MTYSPAIENTDRANTAPTDAALVTSKPAALAAPVALPAGQRFDSIDGLRGVACLLVLFFHCWEEFGGAASISPAITVGGQTLSLSRVFARGWGGVDLFFVLSGFCLAYPIVSRPQKPVDWRRYAIARVRRIVPPYWGAMLVMGFFAFVLQHWWSKLYPIVGSAVWWPGHGRKGLAPFFASMLFYDTQVSGTFWTLVVEWRWYFVFPLGIWLWRRAGGPAVFAAGLGLAAIAGWVWKSTPVPGQPPPPTHTLLEFMPLFALGIWAAALAGTPGESSVLRRGLLRFSGVGMLLGIVLVLLGPDFTTPPFNPGRSPGFFASLAGAYSASHAARFVPWGTLGFFAVLAAVRRPLIRRVLAWSPLVWVGTFSYSLYLIHYPLVRALSHYFRFYLRVPQLQHSWVILGLLQNVFIPALAITSAYAFFLVCERPFLTKKRTAAVTSAPQSCRS